MWITIDKSTKEVIGLYNDRIFVDDKLYELKEVSFKDLFGRMTFNDELIKE